MARSARKSRRDAFDGESWTDMNLEITHER
jgi:hypothetical protein